MSELLGSEAFWKVVVMVLALVWSLPQVVSWRARIRASRSAWLLEIGELAVSAAEIKYTQRKKDEAPDGNLSTPQKEAARKVAADLFVEIANQQGCGGIAEALSPLIKEAVIQRAHDALKKGKGVEA